MLTLGQYAAAAQAVANVPDGARYQMTAAFDGAAATAGGVRAPSIFAVDRVADREGDVGLPYLSSHDPRSLAVAASGDTSALWPNKYARIDSTVRVSAQRVVSYTPFVVADWVEARLIQAEAALRANDVSTWLQILNHLRATPDTGKATCGA